jgi:2-polyprenyl-6-methoxyphenol hydroxylase-like FAD-dependent oxidoreductase
MSPQLGQGANLALIDAEKLVDALVCGARPSVPAHAAAGRAIDVASALEEYTRERWWRINFYQAQSRCVPSVLSDQNDGSLICMSDCWFGVVGF